MFDFLFYLFAVIGVGAALFVAFTPNVVHAALALVPTFGSLAGLYLLLTGKTAQREEQHHEQPFFHQRDRDG